MSATREVKGDVAAVVDDRLGKAATQEEGGEQLVGHGARDRGHRRDERGPVRPDRRSHALRDRAGETWRDLVDRSAQSGKLGDQLFQ